MSEIDYAELFKSPLDDQPDSRERRWGPIIGGLIVGILVVGALDLLNDSDEAAASPTTTAPTTTLAAFPPTMLQYPPGFAEIAPGLAAQPFELIRSDDTVLVAFHTALQRDSDPVDTAWPIGGSWWLETAEDTGVQSSRVVLGRFSPGVFAVEFPRSGDVGEASAIGVRMIERWDLATETGAEQVPFDSEPYVMPEPLTIPFSTRATLVIDRLELGAFLGRLDWRLDGSDGPIGRVVVEVTLLDATGDEVGTYGAFPAILDPSNSGVTELSWLEPFPQGQEGAVTAEVRYTVGLVDVFAADVGFDLQGVPAGR